MVLGQIAREAGEAVLGVYGQEFGVDYKGPGDPVTDADRGANDLICDRLRAEFPGVTIVAEESEQETFRGYQEQERVFFVDPLDGTREFVARNGQFSVMIGLLVGDVPRLGVVFAPTTDTLWCGDVDAGAFRVTPAAGKETIRVSNVVAPRSARITVSRSRRSERLGRALSRIGPAEIAPMGSAGLKGSHVAEGSADAYVSIGRAGKHWDACAMHAIALAAGGRVTDGEGEPLNYRALELDLRRGLLVGNPELHAALLERLLSDD
jgi:3'(2'), 5'-bisphosphate nucleotidase